MRVGGRGLKEMHRKLLPCGWAEGKGRCPHCDDVDDKSDDGLDNGDNI